MGLWRTRQPPSLPPLGQVGPRLKQQRARRGVTLTRTTGGVQARKINVPANTRVPHWFGSTGDQPVEILSIFGSQGAQARARTVGKKASAE